MLVQAGIDVTDSTRQAGYIDDNSTVTGAFPSFRPECASEIGIHISQVFLLCTMKAPEEHPLADTGSSRSSP